MFNIQHMIPIPNDKLTIHATACNKFAKKTNTYAMKLNRTFLGAYSLTLSGAPDLPPFPKSFQSTKERRTLTMTAHYNSESPHQPTPSPHTQKRDRVSPNRVPAPRHISMINRQKHMQQILLSNDTSQSTMTTYCHCTQERHAMN